MARKNLGSAAAVIGAYLDKTQEYGQDRSGHGAGWGGYYVSGPTIYFRDDTLYSYGTHFPLCRRIGDERGGPEWYLFNGDAPQSRTTGTHQQELRRGLGGRQRKYHTIPFTALRNAGLGDVATGLTDPQIIDEEGEREWDEEVTSRVAIYKDNAPSGHQPGGWGGQGRWGKPIIGYRTQTTTVKRHLLGAVLFKVAVPGTDERYYLSGLDATGRIPQQSYFLAQLVRPAETVADAYESMKPLSVAAFEAALPPGSVRRQGDMFFVPVKPDMATVLSGREKEQPYTAGLGQSVWARAAHPRYFDDRVQLPGKAILDPRGSDTRHVATRMLLPPHEDAGAPLSYVRGTVRHTGRDHAPLALGGWHAVYQNTVVGSWTVDTASGRGRVD